MSGVVSN